MDKLKSLLVVLFSSVLILTGCTNLEDENVDNDNNDLVINNNENDEDLDVEQTNQDDDKSDDKNETDVDDGTNNENDKNTNVNNDDKANANEDTEEQVSNIKEVALNISSLDANSGETIVLGNLNIDENKALEENLNVLIKEIARLQFDNAPIQLVKIENNVAYIDLHEGTDKNYWSTGYFQGSTGGSITEYTLTESILQRNYSGKWINGVHFSYEGKTNMEFDHIGMDFFGNIISR
ncbi:MAG: hypothetical protein ACRCXT_18945 [Paraclostridium sp.]